MDEPARAALVREAAGFLGLEIPDALIEGVAANLELLRVHAATILALELPAEEEAAGVFRP